MIHNVKWVNCWWRNPSPKGSGRDVTNREIPPKRGRTASPRGKNTVADGRCEKSYANCDGHLQSTEVMVDSVLVISQDIDFATGNIDFLGNIIIHGNIAPGFKVHATGDIEIKGFVEGAQVIAEGSIEVKGGITSGAKGLVKAGQNVYARFIENSIVEAGGDVVVRDSIMQSQVVVEAV